MSTKYQYENLLRDPYEVWSASMYGIGSFLMLTLPETFMMPPSVGYGGAAVFAVMGASQLRYAQRLKKYQKQLTNLPTYTISSHTVGTSHLNLWIGKGFMWDGKHAQRLFDLDKPQSRKYIDMPKLYKWARNFEIRYEHKTSLNFIKNFTRSQNRFNPVKPIPDLGGSPIIHAVGMWEGEEDIYIPQENRNGHMLVLGTTRVGKTRLLEIMVAQDIRRNDVVIVIDPKGDADLLLRMYAECIASGREDDFHIFHLGFPEISDGYNPIGSFMRMTEVASRIANQMPGEGQSAAFRDFVWGYVNTISVALVTMGIKPTYELIKTHKENFETLFVDYMTWYFDKNGQKLKDINWKEQVKEDIFELNKPPQDRSNAFKQKWKTPRSMTGFKSNTIAIYKFYLDHSVLHNNVGTSMCSKITYDKNHLDKLTASLDPFLDKMTTGRVAEILIPGSGRPSFDWNDILQKNGVVYIGLDALSDAEVASTVGNSMFSDLTSIAGRIYKTGADYGLPPEDDNDTSKKSSNKKPKELKICLHADEFNELIGKEFIPMLNKAGGAGVQVTAYTQTFPDIEARVGSKAHAQQIIGNFNTIIMLRVRDDETARLMVESQKKTYVVSVDVISGTADNSNTDSDVTFTSSTTQRITRIATDLITATELKKLPKGQAFALINGNQLYKVRMPLPDKNDLKGIPQNIVQLAETMRTHYTSELDSFQFREYLSDEVLNSKPSFILSPQDIGYAAISAESDLVHGVMDEGGY